MKHVGRETTVWWLLYFFGADQDKSSIVRSLFVTPKDMNQLYSDKESSNPNLPSTHTFICGVLHRLGITGFLVDCKITPSICSNGLLPSQNQRPCGDHYPKWGNLEIHILRTTRIRSPRYPDNWGCCPCTVWAWQWKSLEQLDEWSDLAPERYWVGGAIDSSAVLESAINSPGSSNSADWTAIDSELLVSVNSILYSKNGMSWP